jgi:iron complex outermembrane receptor protein
MVSSAPVSYSTTDHLYSFAGGASGSVTSDIKWDASLTHGRSVLDVGSHLANTERLYAAIDAVRDPSSGNIVCRTTLTNPGAHPGCVPINLFGVGSPSQQALNYIMGDVAQKIRNETTSAELSVHGNAFDNWAGPITFALGADWRHVTLDQTSNINPSIPPNFAGIRGIPGGASYFFTANLGLAEGTQTVKEGFAEVNIPLLKDMRFTKSLDLDLAGRSTHYSTSGQVQTWKVGLNWAPINDVRFRFTRSRDIRAPSLIEINAQPSPAGATFNDPHTNVQSLLVGVTQGNPSLKPEKGDTTTVGVVFKPSFVRGLSLSVDYYNIKLGGAIIQPSIPQILSNCENSGGTSPDCALISRPLPFSDRSPANTATSVLLPFVNAATYQVRGIDFELNYATQLSDIASSLPGALNLRVVGSYLLSRKEQVTASSPIFELAGQSGAIDNGGSGFNPTSYPKLRMTFNQDFNFGSLGVSLTERLIGGMKQSLTQVVAPGYNHVKPIVYTDLSVRYKIPGTAIEPFVSVVNLMNTQPPLIPFNRAVPGTFYPTNSLLYDTIGRYFTIGARFKF